MKPTEAAALLTIAAAYDNRKPDADQAKAWAMALDGLRFEDCRDVVVAHYRRSREWLMPVDVIGGVKRVRDKRIADFGPIPAPNHLDPASETFDQDYRRYMIETTRAIGDGTLRPEHVPPPAALTSRDVIRELGQAQSVAAADAVRDLRAAHADAKRELQAAAAEEKRQRDEKQAAREAAREADRKARAARDEEATA